MKPLTLEETRLKEEMKERCLAKGQYIDEKAKEKFNMLCHLEDFEVQYWELQKENEILKENAKNNDKVVDKVNWENQLLKKENKQLKIQISAREEVCNRLENNWNKLKEIAKSQSGFKKRADLKGGLWFEVDDLLDKMHELEQGSDSE